MDKQNKRLFVGLMCICPFEEHLDTCTLLKARETVGMEDIMKHASSVSLNEINKHIEEHKQCFRNRVINNYSEQIGCTNGEINDTLRKLTKREKEILKLVSKGLSSKQIGKELSITYYTACNHIKKIKKKTNIKSCVLLARFALETGLEPFPIINSRAK